MAENFTDLGTDVAGEGCVELVEKSFGDFIEGKWEPFFCLGLVALIFLAVYCFHRVWTRRQHWLHSQSRLHLIQSSEDLGVVLAHYFLPSMAVDRYTFRGMKPKSETISIEFKNLGCRLKKTGKQVLDGVSGSFQHSRLAAIMGPSGAGKTTFLNVLCGKAPYGDLTGSISLNGGELDLGSMKQCMGFVPQDDVVHERLTVRENLHFSAQLRNAPGTPTRVIQDIVEDCLKVLQISHIQESIVGGVDERGISGGQRKRVNIGLEMAACPTVLFLDEPTSGLDATSSLQIVNSLAKMCDLHMTIVMVIHQPRYGLFTLFHDVLLLGVGGRTVYLGPSGGAKGYFEGLGFAMPENENPADWFMDVLAGTSKNTDENYKTEQLFGAWENKVAQAKEKVEVTVRRPLTKRENFDMLSAHIQEEWDKIDIDRSGSLDLAELTRFLKVTCGQQVTDEAAAQLHKAIAGDAEQATKQDLFDYIMGKQQQEQSAHALDVVGNLRTSKTGGLGLLLNVPKHLVHFRVIFTRRLVQVYRESWRRALDCFLIVASAIGVGLMHSGKMGPNTSDFLSNLLIFYLSLALLSAASVLRVFGADFPMYWRERSHDLSTSAFFLARCACNVIDLLLMCTLYAFVYYFVARPPVEFVDYYLPCCLVTLASAGWGYLISVLLPPKNAMLAASAILLLLCGVLGDPREVLKMVPGDKKDVMLFLSMSRWAIAATLESTIQRAKERAICVTPSIAVALGRYDDIRVYSGMDHRQNAELVLLLMTVGLLIASYVGLKIWHRSRSL